MTADLQQSSRSTSRRGATIGKSKPLAGRTVLVVEDEGIVSMELEIACEDAGADTVLTAACVAEALELVEREEIDLAILDIKLPDGDSYPVADALVERDVPFAFHSGHARPDDFVDSFPQAGWCPKPCRSDHVISIAVSCVED